MIFLKVVSDRLGMPPSYMVVDIRWDDYAEESSEEIVQLDEDPTKEIFHNTPPPLSLDRKRWARYKFKKITNVSFASLYQNYNLLKTHQRLFLDDQVVTISTFPIFLIFQHSDSLLADRPTVQCWTSGCVETTHNQVNQSKPSHNQVNQGKPS